MSVKIFHHNDMDGRAAAAVVCLNYHTTLVKCYEVCYDKPLPISELEKDDILYIVDFTPNQPEEFDQIVKRVKMVCWIDHHGTNIKKQAFYDKCLMGLRVEKEPSGALCTWEYFNGTITSIPEALILISDYDTWNHRYGIATKAFEAGLKTVPHQPQDLIWSRLLDSNPQKSKQACQEIIQKGKTVLDFRKIFYKEIISKYAFKCTFEGHTVLACNMPNTGSLLFQSLNTEKYDILSTFCSNGSKIIVSIYSEGEKVDCSQLAQKYGGGGHKGASGFECQSLPFTDIREVTNE